MYSIPASVFPLINGRFPLRSLDGHCRPPPPRAYNSSQSSAQLLHPYHPRICNLAALLPPHISASAFPLLIPPPQIHPNHHMDAFCPLGKRKTFKDFRFPSEISSLIGAVGVQRELFCRGRVPDHWCATSTPERALGDPACMLLGGICAEGDALPVHSLSLESAEDSEVRTGW